MLPVDSSSSEPTWIERRRSTRFPANDEAQVEVAGDPAVSLPAYLRDASRTGMRLALPLPVTSGRRSRSLSAMRRRFSAGFATVDPPDLCIMPVLSWQAGANRKPCSVESGCFQPTQPRLPAIPVVWEVYSARGPHWEGHRLPPRAAGPSRSRG